MIKEEIDEIATWTGQGPVFCRTSSTTWKLAFLNNMVGLFEYNEDENVGYLPFTQISMRLSKLLFAWSLQL